MKCEKEKGLNDKNLRNQFLAEDTKCIGLSSSIGLTVSKKATFLHWYTMKLNVTELQANL